MKHWVFILLISLSLACLSHRTSILAGERELCSQLMEDCKITRNEYFLVRSIIYHVLEEEEFWIEGENLQLWIMCKIKRESNFDVLAEGLYGEAGLMQISPIGLADVNKEYEDQIKQVLLWDPYWNVKAGVRLLKINYKRYGTLYAATKFYNGDKKHADKVLVDYLRYRRIKNAK